VRAPRRLQRRIVRYIVSVVVVSLLASAGALLLSKQRSLVSSLESSARTFSAMVSLPLAKDVELFRQTGHQVLRQQLGRFARLNHDLVRLQVLNVDGVLVMDARVKDGQVELEAGERGGQAPRLRDEELIGPVEALSLSAKRVAYSGRGRVYRVVAPAVEEWGRHTYTLVAYFSYARVSQELLRAGLVTGVFLAIGVLVAYAASALLARTITGGVEKLQAGVQRVAADRFDERVEVDSGDEIQELAESFNVMADRLQASIAALKDAYVRLESLDQSKRNLLANVSHELRTPLTALRGYLELLGDGQLGELVPGMDRAVEVCQRNVGRLTTRIEELVEFARIDRDGAALPMGTVDLATLLHGVVETLWPRLEQKNLFCSLNIPMDLPVVRANGESLERVFLNLLDNAIKFTPQGGSIRVRARKLRLHERDGVLSEVTDTGVGIPADQLQAVFDRFYQVDQSSRRRFGGMGLGLALVHRAIEIHGGSVWLESREGRGSTFSVWLPLERPGQLDAGLPAVDSAQSATLDGTAPMGDAGRSEA